MLKFSLVFILTSFIIIRSFSQVADEHNSYSYKWLTYNTPRQFLTLQQNVTNLQTVQRLLSKGTKKNFSSLGHLVTQAAVSLYIMVPMQQSLAQNAILVKNGITGNYMPFEFIFPEPTIYDVTDLDLQIVETNDYQDFKRLYTVGSETNYLWLHNYNRHVSFHSEQFRNISIDYIIRTMMSYSYSLPAILPFLEESLDNQETDNQRLVNVSSYGYQYYMTPDRPIVRNIKFSSLTNEERRKLKSNAYLSFLNLFSTVLVNSKPFNIGGSTKLHLAVNQFLSPGGVVYNQDFWLVNKGRNIYIEAYFREMVNNQKIFPGLGIGFYRIRPVKNISTNVSIDLWNQPTDLNYYAKSGAFGGALKFDLEYKVKNRKTINSHNWNIIGGIVYKSEGFLPGYLRMDKGLITSLGVSVDVFE